MNQSLTEKSYDYIRSKLESGTFTPGKKLVNRALAEEIGVSVIPVREAINRLTSEGLLEHIPGAGAFVRSPDRQELDHIYVLREALESCAAAEAAKYCTEEQLDEMEYYLERSLKTVQEIRKQSTGHSTKSQFNRWLDDEQKFNERLVEASRNPLLAKVVHENRIISNVFDAQRDNPGLLTVEMAEATCKSKSELIAALRERDSEKARQLMSEHIRRGRKNVLAFLRKQHHAEK